MIEVRLAGTADTSDLGRLLYLHAAPEERAAQVESDFVRDVGRWMRNEGSRHVAFLAVTQGGLAVGCGWLALLARPPRPGNVGRLAADIQSVFVVEEQRGKGVGGALTEAMLDHARAVGAEQVTVHSGRRAVPLYQRAGFAAIPQLMVTMLGTTTG